MARVTLANLTKAYADPKAGPVTAVDRVNLEIGDGEFMVIVGPSGCGKSTLLRMIAGLEDISDGIVTIDARMVNGVMPKDRDIAMVFQNYALYPHMTVRENMAFGLKLRKLPRAEIESRVREAAELLGLGALLERKPKALSGGERQRVAVGRAIVRKPKVFLFDEPLSNLDAKMRVAMRAELAKLHTRLGATMIYVTHDQVEAMTMGDRICVMKAGRVQQVAAPLELYHQPANLFVAGFIGSPPMNLFPGLIQRTGSAVTFVENGAGTAGITMALPAVVAERIGPDVGKRVVLGVRPEDIAIAAGPATERGAVVEVIEAMGAETFLHLHSGVSAFIARVPPLRRFAPGERVDAVIDENRIHLFDAETEAAI